MKNETNTQHTQGEWVIINSEKSITVTTRAFGAICEIPHGGKAIEEHKANAQLIARAPELLKENEQLKELNRIQYEVTADQNLKIQDLKALNAELLEQLKEAELIALVATREEYIKNGMPYDDAFKSAPENHRIVAMRKAIAKAEGKTLVGS